MLLDKRTEQYPMNERSSSRSNLSDEVVIVTGSGRGIGRAIALDFARSGANLVLVDLDPETLNSVKNEIFALDAKAMVCRVDVSQKSEVDKLVNDVIQQFKKIDVLVNNAGIIIRKPMEEYAEDDWDRVIDVNLKGVFNFCHAVSMAMISRRYGRIVNVASIMGERTLPPRASYCASKGGVIALTKDLAAEWAKYGITVNAISPGWVETELTRNYFAQEEVRRLLLGRIPVGRFGHPEEIADMVSFLASKRAGYITGQNFCVDGGWSAL